MLDKMNKNNPFKVPENYFADFHKEMMEKIPVEKKKKSIIPLWKRVISLTAIAAMLAGIVFTVDFTSYKSEKQISNNKNQEQSQKSGNMYASSDDDDFYLYIQNETVRQEYSETFYQ